MKYLIIFVCGVVFTVFCLDYLNLKDQLGTAVEQVRCNKDGIQNNYDEFFHGGPGDTDKGLWWSFFVLRDRVTELEDND